MAVSIVIDVTKNSQNIANNTTNVTVKVNAKWTGGSYNLLEKSGSCTINGTKYTFTSPFNTGRTTSGSCTLYTKTLDIPHNSDGTKTLAVSASYTSGVSSGTVSASANVTLATIPRKSTLSVANGTLGTKLTLSVTRQHQTFKHSIKVVCGSNTVYIKADGSTQSTEIIHDDSSIDFTPPLAWASQNTSGTNVTVKYTLTTYVGSTKVGSIDYTKTCAIPSSVVPSCSISVSDPTGYKDIYGGYIRGLSKLKVVMNAVPAYSSPIVSYRVTADGVVYTSSSFTTNVIRGTSGLKIISASVTDKRGRTSGLASANVTLLDYTSPAIDYFKAERYTADGVADPKGNLIRVNFGTTVTPLNNKNTVTYTLQYKKTTDTVYTNYDLSPFNNAYSVNTNTPAYDAYTPTFEADPGSTYELLLTITDAFGVSRQAKQRIYVSSAKSFMSFRKDYRGIALNKIAEEDDLFDIGWATKFNEPVYGKVAGLDKLPAIPSNSNFNDYMQTGCWAVYRNAEAETISNMPVQKAGRLEIFSSTGEGIRDTEWSYLRQRFTSYDVNVPVYERDISRDESNVWSYGAWRAVSLQGLSSELTKHYASPKVLWSGGYFMTAEHTINLSESISSQKNGIVVVFSAYTNNAVGDYWWQHFFISKQVVSAAPGSGHDFMLTSGNFSIVAMKYLLIHDTKIVGHSNNNLTGTASGITFANNRFVLRRVIGV